MHPQAELLCELARRAYQRQLVSGTEGNLSCRIGGDRVLCTPSGVCKGVLRPADLCVVDLAGNQLSGSRPRSSEVLMHLAIYRAADEYHHPAARGDERGASASRVSQPRDAAAPDAASDTGGRAHPTGTASRVSAAAPIDAVVHTHAPFATAFAVAGVAPPGGIMPEAEVFLGAIPLVPYETPGTPALGEAVAPFVAGHVAALLANHGAVTWAADLERAYLLMETLESVCRTIFLAQQLGGPRALPSEKLAELHPAP
ncbi:MAG: class II aldolase/adducin family protein [Phycisphaerae bacterium]